MEGLILIIVMLGAIAAFLTGIVLLVLYFRSGGSSEPEVYGDLVMCPHCKYMNPLDSAICLRCHRPLPRVRPRAGYPLPPTHYNPPPAVPYAEPYAAPRDAPRSAPSPAMPAPATAPSVAQRSARRPPPVPNRPAGMPHAWLEGTRGALIGQTEVLAQENILVGRSTTCDLQVYDPKVSRQHCRIRYGSGAFYVQDQGSSRGTLVNDEHVSAKKLSNGDRIDIGDTSFVFHLE